MRLALSAALALLLSFPVMAQQARPATPAPMTPPAAGVRPGTPAGTPAPAAAPSSATTPTPAAASGNKVDVNSATEAQLEALPGVGPVRAKAIVTARPYSEFQDLVKKKAIPQSVLDGAKRQMALANINTSSAVEMAKTLPGIGLVRSNAIVAGRPYGKPDELVLRKVLSQGVFDKIKDVIAY